jgi:hypothetical protein
MLTENCSIVCYYMLLLYVTISIVEVKFEVDFERSELYNIYLVNINILH